jgi:predicted transcriptional regulator
MMVVEAMNRAVVTVDPDAPIEAAVERARATGAEHLLVVDEDALVGILCTCDLRDAEPGEHVCDCMTVPVVTVHPDTPLEDVRETMDACAVGCVPVTVGGLVLGTVGGDELLRCGLAAPHPHRHCHRHARHGVRRGAPHR